MEITLRGRALVAGSAEGRALVSREPLSFWGGLDPATGEISDRRHDRAGANVAGRVFVFPCGRGSSTSSATLMESVRCGTAPAAIVNAEVDSILALGSIVADEMYGKPVPIVIVPREAFDQIREDDRIAVHADGRLTIVREASGGTHDS
jgi:predicted aconitase with swiveling domain